MKIQVNYTKNARKDLKGLMKSDASKLVFKVEFFTKQKNPMQYAKKLKAPFVDLYRFRIGVYRVIFQVNNKGNVTIFNILEICHRKDVYKGL